MDLLAAVMAGDRQVALAALHAQPEQAGAVDAAGVSALLLARYRGLDEVVEAIRSLRPLDLPEAAATGDVARVADLLATGSDVETPSPDGFSPLQLALYLDNPGAAALLLRAGADVEARAANAMGVGALHAAAASPTGAGVALALAAGADVDGTQSGGFTALHEAAHRGDGAMAELLLAAGADAAVRTDDGRTAAELAAGGGHSGLVPLLTGRAGATA
jgi:ankyrin repeat protein